MVGRKYKNRSSELERFPRTTMSKALELVAARFRQSRTLPPAVASNPWIFVRRDELKAISNPWETLWHQAKLAIGLRAHARCCLCDRRSAHVVNACSNLLMALGMPISVR